MHGPGWFLHASHHRAHAGPFELNDLYAVIFAGPSILLLAGGVRWGWWPGATWIGAGIAAYGAIYFGFHDWIVHRRVPHRYVARSRYMKRIVQAHRLHHVVETKAGTVSFGFLVAPSPETLKAELKRRERAGMRAPLAMSDRAH
jgi:beta-carotene 3-hydroxylase